MTTTTGTTTRTRCAVCGLIIAKTPEGWFHAFADRDHDAEPESREATR